MTPSILVLTLITLQAPQGDLDLTLVHHASGRPVGSSRLILDGTTLTGSITAGAVEVVARQESAPEGHVLSYDRTVRKAGRLVSRLTLKLRSDGDGYRLREEGGVGTRRESVRTGKARAILDASWPEAVIPMLVEVDAGAVAVLDISRSKVVLGRVVPREGGARYLDVPGGGPTVDLDGDRGFRRLRLPGEGRPVIALAGAALPAGPTAPATVVEQNVALPSGLAGTLTLPRKRAAAVPGLVLVADSGVDDRDGDGPGLGSGLLRDLAWEFGDRGYAVLRFQPRNVSAPGIGFTALKEDVRAAGMFLGSRVEVDAARLGVIGHGQGGLTSVGAVHDRPDLFAAVIGLAPPARPLREAMVARLRSRLFSEGRGREGVRTAEEALQADLDRIRDLKSGAAPGPGETLLRDLMRLVPVDLYLECKVPLLLVFGEHDRDVPVGHRALLQTSIALHGAGRADLQVLANADHQFLETGKSGSPAPNADMARRRHPSLAPVVSTFLEARLAKK